LAIIERVIDQFVTSTRITWLKLTVYIAIVKFYRFFLNST